MSQVGWTAGLAPDITARLVGVIDLRGGQAVHAVAGDRARYRAVPFCSGSVAELVRHYQRLGVKAFYLADLDAIGGGDPDVATIHAVCRSAAATEVVADVGWRGDESAAKRAAIERLSASCPALRWIAATETCRSALAIDELAELVSPARTLLGLDYRGGQPQSAALHVSESDWLDRALQRHCRGAVILDLAGVGTAAGPLTAEACGRVRRRAPGWRIYSGGGIRGADDLELLLRAGADRCLLATALHPLPTRN